MIITIRGHVIKTKHLEKTGTIWIVGQKKEGLNGLITGMGTYWRR